MYLCFPLVWQVSTTDRFDDSLLLQCFFPPVFPRKKKRRQVKGKASRHLCKLSTLLDFLQLDMSHIWGAIPRMPGWKKAAKWSKIWFQFIWIKCRNIPTPSLSLKTKVQNTPCTDLNFVKLCVIWFFYTNYVRVYRYHFLHLCFIFDLIC